MRLVFAGTPAVAVPALRRPARRPGTRSSRSSPGRTRPPGAAGRVTPSPVGAAGRRARHRGAEARHARAIRTSWTRLRELAPDCCPVVAYGALLPQSALDIPRHGWVNLHFSLLPAWRGAAPVQHAILHGDEITGATTFQIEAGLDTGPVFGVVTEPIRPADTGGDLLDRLAASGARAAGRDAGRHRGRHRSRPCRSRPTASALAPKLTAEDARVDWTLPACASTGRDPRLHPGPGRLDDVPRRAAQARPGSAAAGRSGAASPRASCASSATGSSRAPARARSRLGDVQPPGKRRMPAADWARGCTRSRRAT